MEISIVHGEETRQGWDLGGHGSSRRLMPIVLLVIGYVVRYNLILG